MPICVKTDVNSKRYVNCVLEDEVKPAINLLKAIKPELNRRALKNKCDNNRAKPYMTENDTVEYVTANFAIKVRFSCFNVSKKFQIKKHYKQSAGDF